MIHLGEATYVSLILSSMAFFFFVIKTYG